jgi:hypothetical protein
MFMTVDGHNVRIESRRKYAHATYTWLEVEVEEGKWASLGDPWKGIKPPKEEVRQEAERVLKSYTVTSESNDA